MIYTFRRGEMTEGYPWDLVTDSEVRTPFVQEGAPCRHATNPHEVYDTTVSGEKRNPHTEWVLRATVCASNEGRNNGTEVCLDCILEAARAHGLLGSPRE